MNNNEVLDDETKLVRAQYEIESAEDDFGRSLFLPALYEIEKAKEYLDEMEVDCPKRQELYKKIGEYYPKIKKECSE